MAGTNFNKKIFAMLIEQARGDRTIRRFAAEADISYVQLRKLHAGLQENPPGRKLIKKLAENSVGGIEYEDYLFAAGIRDDDMQKELDKKQIQLLDNFSRLSAGQKKTAEDFIRFLLKR